MQEAPPLPPITLGSPYNIYSWEYENYGKKKVSPSDYHNKYEPSQKIT